MFKAFSLVFLFLSFLSLCHAASPDIVFVGAGPVGLYTAIQTKLYNPMLEIEMLERQDKYQRNQVLQIEKGSFQNSNANRDFQTLIRSIGTHEPILALEEKLLKYALSLGIQIQRGKYIQSLDDIKGIYKDEFSKIKVIVGSDGAKSKLRKLFVSEEELQKQTLSQIVQVNYTVTGKTKKLPYWTSVLPLLPRIYHPVMEHVGRYSEKDNTTTVSIRIVAEKQEYEKLKTHVANNPIHWGSSETNEIPAKLQSTIRVWLEQRKAQTGEVLSDPKQIKVTVTELGEYYARKVYLLAGGTHFFLVGDSAFGVPYFRSINNGIESGNVLSKVLARIFNPNLNFDLVPHPQISQLPLYTSFVSLPGISAIHSFLSSSSMSSVPVYSDISSVIRMPQNTPRDYENFVVALQSREKLVAHAKTLGLKAIEMSIGSSQDVYHSTSEPVINALTKP